MKIFSCIKAVPDSTARLSLNDSKTWIKTQDLSFVPSEADNYALEEALRLREKHGGEVTVLSVGSDEAAKVLRAGLATGADKAIQISLPYAELQQRGESGVAEVLAAAIQKDGGADLVLAGVQSDDVGSGATGVMLAEFLGCAHATIAIGVEADPDARKVAVRRELEGGAVETVELPLPAVVTVQYGANQPRYASLKGIMAAKKKSFTVWTAADVGVASEPLLDIKDLAFPERPSRVQMLSGTPEETVTQLVEKLRKEAKVL